MKKFLILCLSIFSFSAELFPQSIPAGLPILEEYFRRKQLSDYDTLDKSFLVRPILISDSTLVKQQKLKMPINKLEFLISPFVSTTRLLSGRPYGWGDYGMISNPGIQTYLSGGIELKYHFLNFTFRPEMVLAQNSGFETNLSEMTNFQIASKYLLWNYGDSPEKFGDDGYTKFWWGQSKLTFQYGAFELGGSTQNIWWGPGQFNALTFSNNAQGFPHLTLNTTKPAKTFLGNFEGQLIMGRLENSGIAASQNQVLNDRFFTPFSGDARYLNAITVSYNPKWIKGLFIGFSRTFQQYNANRGNTFIDWFPIFERFQKKNFVSNNNFLDFDANGRDQTITLFGRLVVPKTKSEIYFEYGRRDHAFNWRDFILSPDHARAFIFGFNQLFEVPEISKTIQIRSEITHQQESINRIIRYGIRGGISWHTHNPARGFSNYGQPLGVGIGTGSNLQTIEVSLVEGMDKMGIVFERLANNQDFYYKAQLQNTERRPWIDLSLGFLYDKKFDNLLFSSKLQIIHARNYQWQLDPTSTPDFPKGENLTSILAQVSLIYFWKKE